jgi:hypothetical protein
MRRVLLVVAAFALMVVACASGDASEHADERLLVGAWKSNVQFQDGAFAAIKDLRFMYVFNAGGTMTESSNYDAAPPVPPAYGVWRAVGAHRFEATYEFFVTRPATPKEAAASGTVWLPTGHGVLTETISLSRDGDSFDSTIRFEAFDETGAPAAGGGTATGHAERIGIK